VGSSVCVPHDSKKNTKIIDRAMTDFFIYDSSCFGNFDDINFFPLGKGIYQSTAGILKSLSLFHNKLTTN
jgi:hypothetical protein